MDKQVGLRIKMLRVKKGLTQEDLGEKLGLDRGTISKIERCENAPTAKTLVAIREILGVSIDWILTGEDYPGIDEELRKMIDDLTNNQTAKIKVLSFFYHYKAKHLSQFLNSENIDLENVENG
ncbi:MAG: helix-turn-helix transcriptional regulator [Candidatus Aminicenantes bacterium]|nr:MAG: helix-turn-helix transcriptional regulator [Candidatus Aminicenantes bacterium]